MLKRLKNYVLALHHNGVGLSYLATRTPLIYPVTLLVVAPLVTVMFLMDPEEFDHE